MQTLKKLVPVLAQRHRLTQKQMDAVITDIQDHVIAALANGEVFALGDIGRFVPKDRKERSGRNPQTGKTLTIPARRQVQFKISSTLVDALNQK